SNIKRTVITEAQLIILRSFFDKGMTRKGSQLIKEAIRSSGLPQNVIENWIGNYKREIHLKHFAKPPRKNIYSRDLSAYNLFCREFLKNKGMFHVLSSGHGLFIRKLSSTIN
ncbi:hypothetical protein AOXY_G2441, partial [Acipenser oxyrinchus oxyrinchus]